MKLLIKNADIISENFINKGLADIYIENGKIKDVGFDLNADALIIDADGKMVLPGLIDMSCNICEVGYENKDNIISVSRGAAKGGYTSITASPNTTPIIDNKTVVEYIYTKASEYSKVNIFPYGSITKGCLGNDISEIGELILAGVVGLSDGGVNISDSSLLRNILIYSTMFDIPIITYCQDNSIAKNGVVNNGYISTKMGLIGMPREAEEIMVARNLILAKHTGARLHISHVTTKGSVELIKESKDKGVKVTCETCPHYFTLTEKAVENFNTFAKVNPPLRTEEDIEAIKNGIKDGTIDVISTGHSPAYLDRKITEFDNAAFGISSIETSLVISYLNLVKSGIISLYDLIKCMSEKPAEILRLKNKGKIEKGYDADLSIFDPECEFKINPKNFCSRAKYSPYENLNVIGKVTGTIVNGKIIYKDENMC